MERMLPLLLLMPLIVLIHVVQDRKPRLDQFSLRDSELAFAAMARTHGIREAFLHNLADDGILFLPRPVNGKKYYEGRAATKDTLEWSPAYVEVSRSGDLGFTTGPWEFRSAKDDKADPVFGHFITVWRKRPREEWRVAVDIGCVHQKPREMSPETEFGGDGLRIVDAGKDGMNPAKMSDLLTEKDRSLSKLAGIDDPVEAYLLLCAEDIRVYRMGSYPAKGKAAARTLLVDDPEDLIWEPQGAGAALSGDLGFTLGTARKGREEMVSYVRIWRRGSEGGWKIAVDCALPISSSESSE